MCMLIYNLHDIKIFAWKSCLLNKKENKEDFSEIFSRETTDYPRVTRSGRSSVRLLVFFLFSLACLSSWRPCQGNLRE